MAEQAPHLRLASEGGQALLAGLRTQPHNLEAEQALLGAVLVNNETYHRVAEFLRGEHFFEPVHQRLFEVCAERIGKGMLADPKALFHLFDEEEALKELDGARYLTRLAHAAETIINAVEYGRVIHELAVKRSLIRLGEDLVNEAYDPKAGTPALEQIEGAEQKLFALAQIGETRGGFRDFSTVLTSTIRLVESAYHKAGQITGVPTGLTGLDEKLAGLQPSDLLILAGRPSMGKTALAVTLAANAAAIRAEGPHAGELKHPNHTVAVFSLEMSAEQLAMRLLAAEAQISSDELRRGQLRDEDEWQRVVAASQSLAKRPLYIDDTPALSIAALRSRARRLKRMHGLSLIVVDYLQLLKGTSTGGNNHNRVQEISEISQGLKAIAKELMVPVLALSQLSRAVESREDKRPLLSDLRESGSIEQDADVVMFVFREEYYLARSEPMQRDGETLEKFQQRHQEWIERCNRAHNRADIIIAKQRNGSIGNIALQFDPGFGRFRNLEMGYDDPV
ncbi:MAG: replicative DNA helicase [Geminicoccaceae bacterium]|nr:replicative DNA helicase [Geminicoccaceae bacterium]